MTVRILDENFLDLDLFANNTVSSEQTAFPDENLYVAQRRSKVWRSNGYWDVTSSNNTIVFRETIAVDLTATIAVDTYNSDTLFFAAVKTAFEATGASTYTISRDSVTNKIKILSGGGGGGGLLQLVWTDGASAGFAGIAGFDTSTDDEDLLEYTAGELRIHTDEWVQWDFGISTNPDAFVLIGPRNQPIKISTGATIKLQANETDVWTSPSFDQTITYNENVMSLFKTNLTDDGLHTEALRFWRVQIIDNDNPLGFVEVGNLFLGDFFTASRGRVQFPLNSAWVDRSPTIFSEGGQTFSDVREKTEIFNLQWLGLTIADREEFDGIFDTFGTSVPLFVSLDPDNVFSTDISMLRFVKFERAPTWRLNSPRNFSMTMALREEL